MAKDMTAERPERCGPPLGFEKPVAPSSVGFGRPPSAPAPEARFLSDEGEGHLMTFAPTGAGKGVSYAIPALLTYPGSVVAIDPKGELAEVTARARREMGQEVVVLDPFRITRHPPAALNPLDLINAASDQAIDDCAGLSCAIATEIGVKDPFWDERAKHLITQTLLFVAADQPPALKTFHEVWYLLNQGRREFELTTKAMSRSKNAQVRAGAGMITTAEARVLASIVSSAQRFVEPFRSDRVARAMGRTSFDLQAFICGAPISVYLVMPPERLASHAAVLRLWLSAFLILAFRRKHRPPLPTLFLIDEAAQLGRLEHLVTAVTLLRGYGVKTWTFWQDAQQLEAAYPAEWRTLFNNAETHLAFGRMTPMAVQALADLFDVPRGRIYDLGAEEALLLQRGRRARTIRRLDYRADPALSLAADPNPRHEDAPERQSPPRAAKPRIRLKAGVMTPAQPRRGDLPPLP